MAQLNDMKPWRRAVLLCLCLFPVFPAVADDANAVSNAAPSRPTFEPGKPWLDTAGVHIDAHGGAILYENKTYYWFGELQTGGRRRLPAASVYTSSDLYHWTNGGAVLTRIDDHLAGPMGFELVRQESAMT